MYHEISTDNLSNETISTLSLTGDKYIPIQSRVENKCTELQPVFKSLTFYPDPHLSSSGTIHNALILTQRSMANNSCVITQFCYSAEIWLRAAAQAAAFGNIKLIAGVYAASSDRLGIKLALQNGIYIPYWIKDLMKAPTRRESLIMTVSFVGTLIANDIRSFHFYTLNKPRVAQEVLWLISSISLKSTIMLKHKIDQ